jgi:hypothetical protein
MVIKHNLLTCSYYEGGKTVSNITKIFSNIALSLPP